MGVGARIPVVVLVVAGLALGRRTAAAQEASADAQLAQAKTALAKYQDPMEAVRNGYFSTVAVWNFRRASTNTSMASMAGTAGCRTSPGEWASISSIPR